MTRPLFVLALIATTACSGGPPVTEPVDSGDAPVGDDSGEVEPEVLPETVDILVRVTLDGEPAVGAQVMQPGVEGAHLVGEDGTVVLPLSTLVNGRPAVAASHPDARVWGEELDYDELPETLDLPLVRFDTSDNLLYPFQDSGSPTRRDTTAYCAHCHQALISDYWDSAHRQSASNVVVQDLYAGAAGAFDSETLCTVAGGQWWSGIEPGTGASTERCYLGEGVLPDLNEDCGTTSSCDTSATAFGACADCHAPAIDGELGGRDLLEAGALAHETGVTCDVCHKVESVHLDSPLPGVAGRLKVLRPSEEQAGALGPYKPLTFGPYADVLNPRMGSVPREHYADGSLCGGCHQYDQEVLVPGAAVDTTRWPDGRLPVHSTWAEWEEGPFGSEELGEGVACTACHMPPDPTQGNGADLYTYVDFPILDTASGWERPPGAVRRHVWFGPRSSEQRMIDLAAAVDLAVAEVEGGLEVAATTTNVGPAHAIPTGEPMRHILLLVEARCDGELLATTGGDVVPDFGGALDRREEGEDWTTWPGAQPGDHLRLVSRTGSWHDYTGHGPFGDGSFEPVAKGMPVEEFVAELVIIAVDAEGGLTLDGPVPEAQVAYLVRPADGLPDEGAAPGDYAGLPGWGFARVMVGAAGDRMVPHHRAVDVASDNRLLPTASWTSHHRFEACTGEATVDARLVYRRLPAELAAQKGWELTDLLMAQAAWSSP